MDTLGSGTQGGHIGQRTNEFLGAFGGKSPFAPGSFGGGSFAPGAFGGGTGDTLTPEQKKTICKAQKFLDSQQIVVTDAILDVAAKTLQGMLGLDTETLLVALKNPAFCSK